MRHRNTQGFAMPVVLFTLVIMSIMAVAMVDRAMTSAGASRAVRSMASAEAAAEWGVREAADTYLGWDSIATGETIELPVATIAGMPGAMYQVRITRIDGDTLNLLGTQRMFVIASKGYDIAGGEHVVTMVHQSGVMMTAGLATSATATTRGDVDVQTGAVVSGFDANPPEWGPTCGTADSDRPGLTMNDSLLLDDTGGILDGSPPVAEVPLNDSTLSYFGDIEWDDLRAMAHDTVIGAAPRDLIGCADWKVADGSCGVNEVGPRYNADGTCNTAADLNWGSNDPADPCYGFFPILLIQEEIDINNCDHCNGIFVLDSDTTGGVRGGAELDVEADVVMRGLIFGRGCVEFQERADFRGSVFVDGTYNFGECNDDAALDVHDLGTELHYSSCAIERALLANGLGLPVLAFDRVRPIGLRAFGEPLR